MSHRHLGMLHHTSSFFFADLWVPSRFAGQKMVHAKVRINETASPIAVDYLNLSGKHAGTVTLGIMEWLGDEVLFLMAAAGAPRPAAFDEKKGTRTRWKRR
jgi:hypothetical protein